MQVGRSFGPDGPGHQFASRCVDPARLISWPLFVLRVGHPKGERTLRYTVRAQASHQEDHENAN
jgi:hypothetical protein